MAKINDITFKYIELEGVRYVVPQAVATAFQSLEEELEKERQAHAKDKAAFIRNYTDTAEIIALNLASDGGGRESCLKKSLNAYDNVDAGGEPIFAFRELVYQRIIYGLEHKYADGTPRV